MLRGNSQALWPATTTGEGERLGLEFAEAADGIENQCGLGGRGESAEWPLRCPLGGSIGWKPPPASPLDRGTVMAAKS